jgi:serine/threonine protein kinase
MLEYDPSKRITSTAALQHPYFSTEPLPCDPGQIKIEGEYKELNFRDERTQKI